MKGTFTISLDYELHWGVFDKKDRSARSACYHNTLKLVPQMLDTFTKNEVHVTWAVVGSLFAKDQDEWNALKPNNQPHYTNEQYSAYKWAEKNGLAQEYHWAHFAPESVRSILDYPGQELGTHTFSHYYCLEKFAGKDAFGDDLSAAKKAGLKFGVAPVSLVFPRNQFNPGNLKTCYETGIRSVRTNPNIWFWAPVPDEGGGLMRKIFRTGDAYIPMQTKRTSYRLESIDVTKGEPVQLPASRFLRPWHPKYNIANKMALRRVLREMQAAAKNNECYHLWWHPENFGDYPEQNMDNLAVILSEYRKLKDKYGMCSLTMGETASLLMEKN